MIHSHPTFEQLSSFASGSAPLSISLGLSGHLEYCQTCASQVKRLQTLGAVMMEQIKVPVTSDDVMERLMSNTIDRIAQTESAVASPSSEAAVVIDDAEINTHSGYRLPKVLRQFIKQDYNELKWTTLSPSFKIATLLKDTDGTQIALSRVKPGGAMPHHKHMGDEMTLVLEGSFSDESGLFEAGDFIMRDSSHKHHPVVTMDGECICLMVLDGPVQFTGFFTRLLNPLLRLNHS